MRDSTRQLTRLTLALALLHALSPGFGSNRSHAETDERADGGADYVRVTGCRLLFVDDVQLASERAGILEHVAKEGASIARGAAVAQLRDSVLRASLAIAQREAANDVEIRFARKAADLAQLNYERAAQANRTLAGTVSDLELSELKLAAGKAALQLEQAEHQFAVAALRRDEIRERLATLQTSAPFDAFVRTVSKKPGEFVQEGELIAEVVRADNVRVEGYIDASNLQRVQPGQRVEVRLDDAGTRPGATPLRFYGELGFVDVKVEPVSQKVRVWADVKNTPLVLREGLRATMFIDVAKPNAAKPGPSIGSNP